MHLDKKEMQRANLERFASPRREKGKKERKRLLDVLDWRVFNTERNAEIT